MTHALKSYEDSCTINGLSDFCNLLTSCTFVGDDFVARLSEHTLGLHISPVIVIRSALWAKLLLVETPRDRLVLIERIPFKKDAVRNASFAAVVEFRP